MLRFADFMRRGNVAVAASVAAIMTLGTFSHATSISASFHFWTGDPRRVGPRLGDPDDGETAMSNLGVASNVHNSGWKNIYMMNSDAGVAPTAFASATQGGSHLDILDDTGDGSDTGTITVNGMASNGMPDKYWVLVYFESNNVDRNHTIEIGGNSLAWLDGSPFSGTFVQATGSGFDANYMLFEGLTATSFTIDTTATNGRGAIAGLQIMPAPTQGTLFVIR